MKAQFSNSEENLILPSHLQDLTRETLVMLHLWKPQNLFPALALHTDSPPALLHVTCTESPHLQCQPK